MGDVVLVLNCATIGAWATVAICAVDRGQHHDLIGATDMARRLFGRG
jgi:hypothetical protein